LADLTDLTNPVEVSNYPRRHCHLQQ